jgi:hypothetical protein
MGKKQHKKTKGFKVNDSKQKKYIRGLKDKKQLKPFESRRSYDGK